jgi:hypothetical protein
VQLISLAYTQVIDNQNYITMAPFCTVKGERETVGSWQLAVGSWQLAVGSWRLPAGRQG